MSAIALLLRTIKILLSITDRILSGRAGERGQRLSGLYLDNLGVWPDRCTSGVPVLVLCLRNSDWGNPLQ